MKYYLGKLCYTANIDREICDNVAEIILIQSDDDLTEVHQGELEKYYEIQELLEQNDCEELHLEEIDEKEYEEEWVPAVKEGKMVSLFINKSML